MLCSLDNKIQNSVKRIAKEETIKIMTDTSISEREPSFVSNQPLEKSLKINLVVKLRVKTNNCTNVF